MKESLPPPTAREIVGRMMHKDAFSQWLGIEILEAAAGCCSLRMTVRPEMCNGFGIAHGGIAYSLADSALAFAANGGGRLALSAKTSIAHLEKIKAGDCLIAHAKEMHSGRKLAQYQIDIRNTEGALLAYFEGTVYLSSKHWNDL